MSERKKKTGDVIWWGVVDCDGNLCFEVFRARHEARGFASLKNDELPDYAPHRIAKVVLAK